MIAATLAATAEQWEPWAGARGKLKTPVSPVGATRHDLLLCLGEWKV
jgi:hypothetical protein